MSQAAMNLCANGEALREDRERVVLLRRLMFVNSRRPNILSKIQAEESAWLAYRSAYVAVAFPARVKQYGSAFPMEADLLWATLTRQHIADLRHLFNYNTSTS